MEILWILHWFCFFVNDNVNSVSILVHFHKKKTGVKKCEEWLHYKWYESYVHTVCISQVLQEKEYDAEDVRKYWNAYEICR